MHVWDQAWLDKFLEYRNYIKDNVINVIQVIKKNINYIFVCFYFLWQTVASFLNKKQIPSEPLASISFIHTLFTEMNSNKAACSLDSIQLKRFRQKEIETLKSSKGMLNLGIGKKFMNNSKFNLVLKFLLSQLNDSNSTDISVNFKWFNMSKIWREISKFLLVVEISS